MLRTLRATFRTLASHIPLLRGQTGKIHPKPVRSAERLALIERTSFHDSSLIRADMQGDRLRLHFEDVWLDDDIYYRVTVTLGGIRRIVRDDAVVETFRMEGEDGRILTFKRSGHTAKLVLEWWSFSPPREETRAYTFEFATFDLRAEVQEDRPD